MKSKIVLAEISAKIKAKRRETGLGLRAAADVSKISASTLSRIERGAATSLPDTDTLTKLATWLDTSINSLINVEGRKDNSPKQTIPEIVEVHLRADKELNSKAAQSLATMFKMMYEQLKESEKK
jgi:transcriptional regulator with XRE-family HTH domain